MMVKLSALDARNPAAFLAALGALRLASDGSETPLTLHWERDDQTWTATCGGESAEDPEALIAAIARGHEMRDLDAEFGWESDIMKLSRDEVRRLLCDRLPNGDGDTTHTTLWPAAVVGACLSELPTAPSGNAPYTPLRLIPRQGRAKFLASAHKLSESERLQDSLRPALFGPWRYSKDVNSLSWDPGATLSARAYTAHAPTDFGPLGVAGAMLLAVAALPLFPLLPTGRTTYCRGFGDARDRFIWPVWTRPASIRAVRVLLGLPILAQDVKPDEQLLARHRIAVRMEARISKFGVEGRRVLGWGCPTAVARQDENRPADQPSARSATSASASSPCMDDCGS